MALADEPARSELVSLFPQTAEQNDLMAECLSILRLYNLEPQDLFYKFEAFVMSRPSGLRAKLSAMTLDSARQLRQEIQREVQAKAVASMGTPTADKGAVKVQRKGAGDLGGLPKSKTGLPSRLSNSGNNANLPSPHPPSAFATPQRATPTGASSSAYRPNAKLAPPTATPTGRTSNGNSAPSSPVSDNDMSSRRPHPHTLVETLNPHLGTSSGVPAGSRARVALTTPNDTKAYDYRYMFEKVSARAEAFDEQIDDYAELMRDVYGLVDFGDPHFATDDDIYTVGRVLSPPTDGSRATAGSMYLESSRHIGGGKRVALRFAPGVKVRGGSPGVKGFGLFPGCLVCVKGRNGGAGAFVVDEVLMSSTSELLAFQHGERLASQAMSMHVAAGPFTLDDDLTFAPFAALIDVCVAERPDILILLGPFVSDQHPLVASGALTQFPQDIFRDRISAQLARLTEASPGTQVLLVPSVHDIVSRHVAFPQAALDRDGLGLPKRGVRLLPNPCTIQINEVVVALSSVDVLFHLRKEELFQRADEADPDPAAVAAAGAPDLMANAVRHVLGQKSFYPLFPPPEQLAGDVNLDATHHKLMALDDVAPDVLILPSKLKHFSKSVDSTLVVNPSHLSRPHGPGMFAKLHIHPTPRRELEGDGADVDMLADGGMREHAVFERARSEIWRI